MDALRIIAQKFDKRQNLIIRLVEGIEDLVLGDRHRLRAGDAPLHLDEAQLARAGHAALDVVAELLELAVARRETQACLLYTSPSPRDRTRSRMPSSA